MKRVFAVAVIAAGCFAAARTYAQAQSPAADNAQKPAPAQQSKPAEANAFPEDTSNVPVMPTTAAPPIPDGSGNGGGADSTRLALPASEADPARSPDDAAPEADSGSTSDSSSSLSGMDKLLPVPDDDDQNSKKHRKMAVPGPEHHETAAEDIEVGKYYLETKNWKAALSRFESALVFSPDEPDVYWGLAESARNLGLFAQARGYYQKVAEYDPDSKHGKEAMKALKQPEIANAKAAPPTASAK